MFVQKQTLRRDWGRPGFDVGSDAAQGMPRRLSLVNQLAKNKRKRRIV
jgi:hypothetical protein